MKLYLKSYFPNGQRHFVINESNLQKERPGFLLFPDRCDDEIPNEKAKILLRQNSNLISESPMDQAEIKKFLKMNSPGVASGINSLREQAKKLGYDIVPNGEAAKIKSGKKEYAEDANENDEEIVTQDMRRALTELAKMTEKEFKGLGRNEITEYGKRLLVKVPLNIQTEERLKILSDRRNELSAIENDEFYEVVDPGNDL